jgi:hypothetical protein
MRGPRDALPEEVFIFHHQPLSRSYCGTRLRTYARQCGVKVTPHQLRHTCATLLLNAGAPVLSVQMILGHQHIDTTMGYARLYDGTVEKDYFQAMDQIEGLIAEPRAQISPQALIALLDNLESCLGPEQLAILADIRARILVMSNLDQYVPP